MTHTNEWYKNWKKPNLVNGFNERGYWIDYVDGLEFGFGIDLSKFTYINAKYGVKIGDKVEIGQHCSILSNSTINSHGKELVGKIEIGEGSYIGSHSTIMPNVRIGKNCIIGAYSYVDKDIPDNIKLVKGIRTVNEK